MVYCVVLCCVMFCCVLLCFGVMCFFCVVLFCFVVLFFIVFCCFVLCCDVLCCVVLCCGMLCYIVLCFDVVWCIMLCCVVLCCVVLCCVVLCRVVFRCFVFCFVVLCCVMSCCVMLCYVILCYVFVTHPLSLIKLREHFNVPDNQSGIKQRILLELDNIVNSISADILSSLAGTLLASILAQNFLLKSRSTIDSIITWMDNFYQELVSTEAPSKDSWLLVCSCIRCFFNVLRKIRDHAMKVANMQDPLDRAGTYLWAMAQVHCVAGEFIKHQWREHPAISGAINYHMFRHSATSSQHKLLQDEVTTLKKCLKENKSELSKLVSRAVRLESKGKNSGGRGTSNTSARKE